ncbi:hypothetical protein J6590_061214, partial [Homalodisca vitripennis]
LYNFENNSFLGSLKIESASAVGSEEMLVVERCEATSCEIKCKLYTVTHTAGLEMQQGRHSGDCVLLTYYDDVLTRVLYIWLLVRMYGTSGY